jgi:hypothetical protein
MSWTYNLGDGALQGSTMLKKINAARHEEVPGQMKHWNRAGGKVLKGLERRREAEAALYEMRWYCSVRKACCRFCAPPNDYLVSTAVKLAPTSLTSVGHAADRIQGRGHLTAPTISYSLIVNR